MPWPFPLLSPALSAVATAPKNGLSFELAAAAVEELPIMVRLKGDEQSGAETRLAEQPSSATTIISFLLEVETAS